MRAWLLLALLPCTVLALTPQQREQCKRERLDMTTLHAELSDAGLRLDAEAREIDSTERGLEDTQAEIASQRAALQKLSAALDLKGKNKEVTAQQFDQRIGMQEDFRARRDRFELLVKDYNERVRLQQTRRDGHNEQALAHNEQLAQYQQRANAINARCVKPK